MFHALQLSCPPCPEPPVGWGLQPDCCHLVTLPADQRQLFLRPAEQLFFQMCAASGPEHHRSRGLSVTQLLQAPAKLPAITLDKALPAPPGQPVKPLLRFTTPGRWHHATKFP